MVGNRPTLEATNKSRGCGSRKENGLYACVELSPDGMPIEFFLVDPAIKWEGSKTLRSPMFIEDGKDVTHLILGVGKTYYPFVPDFVEETRRLGLSKRVPRDIKLDRMTSNSKFLLMHPRAIPKFEYETDNSCPKNIKEPHECVGSLWSLSGLKHFSKVHEIANKENGSVTVKTPSCRYSVNKPKKPEKWLDRYDCGVFLAFPMRIVNFEYVNKQGKAPPEMAERIREAGFKLSVVPE